MHATLPKEKIYVLNALNLAHWKVGCDGLMLVVLVVSPVTTIFMIPVLMITVYLFPILATLAIAIITVVLTPVHGPVLSRFALLFPGWLATVSALHIRRLIVSRLANRDIEPTSVRRGRRCRQCDRAQHGQSGHHRFFIHLFLLGYLDFIA
jgi:hypothetical protein